MSKKCGAADTCLREQMFRCGIPVCFGNRYVSYEELTDMMQKEQYQSGCFMADPEAAEDGDTICRINITYVADEKTIGNKLR